MADLQVKSEATLVKKAMEAIEKYNKQMVGVLPKEVYGQLVPEEEPDLLSRIMRIFMDIPEDIGIDLFGQIYEYFLGNFALEEGKGGGAFYTPATVVRYMVEVLKPEYGNKKFLDPACGSGGMFVQAARYMHNHNQNAATDDIMQFVCNGVTYNLATQDVNLRNAITTSYYMRSNDVGRYFYRDGGGTVGEALITLTMYIDNLRDG